MSELMIRTIKRKYLFWYFGLTLMIKLKLLNLSFQNKLNSVGEFTDDIKELLFDNIP